MQKIRVFEAFAGYGSTAIAMKRLQSAFPDDVRFEFVGVSEIEPTAIKAYEAIHGECRNFGDICKIDWAQAPDFDLFTYSFPCTSVSSAGKQEGLAKGSGTASSLLWECEKIIAEKKPKYLLMENVKALVQKRFMPFFQEWLNTLDNLGYATYWKVVNAKDMGVAQNRERVFAVSILRSADNPNPTYNFPNPIPLEKCVEDYMEPVDEIGEEFFINQERITNKVLSDILDQPNVRAEMEKLYHEEWSEANSD